MSSEFDAESVQRRLVDAATAWRVQYFASVGSTMDVARGLAGEGAPSGTVVVADEQTAGRGRLGRGWQSRPGGNLYLTAVLRPSVRLLQRLPMLVPLAVAEAIETCTGLSAAIKWPNDVQLDGLKCCGVLIDSELNGDAALALIGIGINVNRDPAEDPELRGIATSIAAMLRRQVDREPLLAELLKLLADLCAEVERGGEVRERWRSRLGTLGQPVRVRSGAKVYDGVAEDVDDDGSLRLRQADGSLVVLPAGEVTLRADDRYNGAGPRQ